MPGAQGEGFFWPQDPWGCAPVIRNQKTGIGIGGTQSNINSSPQGIAAGGSPSGEAQGYVGPPPKPSWYWGYLLALVLEVFGGGGSGSEPNSQFAVVCACCNSLIRLPSPLFFLSCD